MTARTTMTPETCDTVPTGVLSVEQARERILAPLRPVSGTERLNLRQALGRILAVEVRAGFAVPSYRNASMDGYAFTHADLAHSRSLQQVGISWAGQPYAGVLKTGECVRIMTGAMVPAQADTVQMQENVSIEGMRITLTAIPEPGANIRHPGEDMQAGDRVLQAGRKLNAADLGLLASLAIPEVDVLRRPRVAFLSTGDELQGIGQPLQPGQLYDSNRYTLQAMLEQLGVETCDLGVVHDDPEAVRAAFLDAASRADLLITSGGVSVGDADHVTNTLREIGTVSFWRMAMKPGKPLAHGNIGDCLFFGLPGNPVSVMVTFLLFVRPAILTLRGEPLTALPEFSATTLTPLCKEPGRKEYQRGILSHNRQQGYQVGSTGKQESHLLRSMSQANCFIVLERETGDLPAGTRVQVIPFDGLL